MSKTRKLLILANGSISVTQNNSNGYLSFFGLRYAANWLMHNPNNFISQLARYCNEKNTLILDGPGTDIAVPNGSLIKSIAALVDGHIGDNGISSNLEKMKRFIMQQYAEAEKAGETLSIYAVSWSRGGFLLHRIREWLKNQAINNILKIDRLELYLIDTVIGGPSDRLRYLFTEGESFRALPANVKIHGYFSHNGNLNLWEYFLNFLPDKWKFNTPFFSAVIDKASDAPYFSENTLYRHRVTNWLCPATHEALIGRSHSPTEAWSGDIVLADIVRNLAEQSFEFEEQWQQSILTKGQLALQHLREARITCLNNRKFLNQESITDAVLGRELSEDDEILPVSSMRDFS